MQRFFKLQSSVLFLSILVGCIAIQSCHSTRNLSSAPVDETSIVFEPDSIYKSTRIPALVITPKEPYSHFAKEELARQVTGPI